MFRQIITAIILAGFVLLLSSCCSKNETVKADESIASVAKSVVQQVAQPPEFKSELTKPPVTSPIPASLPKPSPLPPAPPYEAVKAASRKEAQEVSSQESHEHFALAVSAPQQTHNTAHEAMAVDYSLIIEEQIKNLKQGQILFNPPKQMKVGVKEIVEVRISKEINENIANGLKGRGVPQVEQIKVGTFMKAHLDGDNFEIKLRSNGEEQPVANEGITPWEWDVTPQKAGSQTLLLTVTVRLKLPNGKEESLDYPVFRRPIDVMVDPVFTIKDFIVKNWKWIISTLIIPLVGWVAKKKWDSRSDVEKG